MKRIYYASLILLAITLITLACNQKKPAPVIKVQKVKEVVKSVLKDDTLIFKDSALSALVQQTYRYFSIFDTINPVGGQYISKNLNLSKPELDTLYAYSDDSPPTDTISGSGITGALSGMIYSNLIKILNWKNINNYDLSLLLKNDLSIAISPDNKLYCFSFDEKTGGTYKSSVSIIYYDPGSGKQPKTFDTGENSIFNHDGYSNIDTINTKQGVKYLLSGNVVGCMTCIGNYIDLVHFEKGDFIRDFKYNVSTRSNSYDPNDEDGSSIIAYDNKLHHIDIGYITNDMTPDCNCGKNGVIEDEPGVSYESDGTEDHVSCVYAFNGKTFILKKKKIKEIKPSK